MLSDFEKQKVQEFKDRLIQIKDEEMRIVRALVALGQGKEEEPTLEEVMNQPPPKRKAPKKRGMAVYGKWDQAVSELLTSHPGEEFKAKDIAKAIGMPKSTAKNMPRLMERLEKKFPIRTRKEGKEGTFYSIAMVKQEIRLGVTTVGVTQDEARQLSEGDLTVAGMT